MAKKLLLIVTLSFILICMFASCDNNEHIHSFGEWQTVKTATCVESGINERYCECGEKQTQTIYALGHQYGEWVITNEPKCTETGSKERYCECGDKQTQSIPLSEHAYDDGTITKEPTCIENGSKTATCTVCNKIGDVVIPSLGHEVDYTKKCSRCGIVPLNMTNTEVEDSKKVDTVSHSVYEYNSYVNVTIYLWDDDNNDSVQVPVYVDIRIEGENGKTLYSETLIKKSSQSYVSVDYNKLTNAYTSKGTLYYKVYNDYFILDEVSIELNKIPWTVNVELPTSPLSVMDNVNGATLEITNISYVINGDDITIYLEGEKTYDKKGDNNRGEVRFGYILYDSDGYVVSSGNWITLDLVVGEKYKSSGYKIYDKIEQGKTYRIDFYDRDW